MALLALDSYQKKSVSTLANGNTKKKNLDNHGGGRQCCSPKDHGTRCAIGLLRTLRHKLDLTRPDEEITKTRIKGITELSNILTG